MRKLALFVAPLMVATLVGGCVSSLPVSTDTSAPLAPPSARGGPDPFATDGENLRLRGKDQIRVQVMREPDFSAEKLRINEDGFVDVPFVGRVQAAGRTTTEVAEDLRAILARTYLRDPRVAVSVVEFASHVVVVEGAFVLTRVRKDPGAIAAQLGHLRTYLELLFGE